MDREDKFTTTFSGKGFMDTRTAQLDDLLIETLEDALCKQSDQERIHEIAKIASEHAPIDIAFVVDHLSKSYRHIVYENLPDLDAQVQFIINTSHRSRRVIFKKIGDEEIKSLLDRMPSDEAVNVSEDLPEWRFDAILDIMDKEKAEHVRELQQYDFNTAGRLMTNEFFAFFRETPIGGVVATIRNNPTVDFNRRIFVLNDDGQLEGYVSARNMIISAPSTPLRQVMRPIHHRVSPDSSRTEIIDIVERYKISTLPVVSEDNVLVGIITHEDVVEAMEELADDTIAQIAGTVEDVSEYEPITKRFLLRAPWLIVTLCAGFFIATTLSTVSNRVWYAIASFFVPLITGMSGNVGIQCSTVLVRAMATGELSKIGKWTAAMKEIMIGIMAGLVFGAAGFLVLYGMYFFGLDIAGSDPLSIGLIVGFGIFGACVTASCLGVLSPLFFAHIGIDPAVAAGPIVTAFNDVLSTTIYCIIARFVSIFVL